MLRHLLQKLFTRKQPCEKFLVIDDYSHQDEEDLRNECVGIIERKTLKKMFNKETESSKYLQLEKLSAKPIYTTEAELERSRREGMYRMWELIEEWASREWKEEPYNKHDII